ncbi:lipid II:glycine glycyltransferase FemX [Halomarina halobia]|uniref:Lipid II:glycine glycyltransferase FemX n=1 Tax=Halomarina halobia TaxID=3033386 RepID=A0ABD6ACZ9_9EURY|nr:GNAT family N-acetyltransferase [Halomarina sp. PSR21]
MSDLDVTTYSSIEALNENQWNNLVEQSNQGTVFQRYEWLEIVERTFDHRPQHVVVSKKDNPVAILPVFVRDFDAPIDAATTVTETLGLKEAVSTRPGYGGPIVLSNESECLDLLLDELEATCGRNVLYHLIRTNDLNYLRYGKHLQKRGYEPITLNCRFVIDLEQSWEEIRSNMDKERRKALRDAHENEYRVESTPLGEADLDRTYDAYVRNMDRIDGFVFPRPFFDLLTERMGDRLQVFTAVVDGIEVGRYVHFLDDERSAVHHYFTAIPDESKFKYYPSELLHEHAIKWAKSQGYAHYDFGGTGTDYTDSVFRFKQKYGGDLVPTLQWQKGLSKPGWNLYKFGRSMFVRRAY